MIAERASAAWAVARGRAVAAVPRDEPPEPPPLAGSAELVAGRKRLAEELSGLQHDLGGLAYEMAIRDHFRLDVLVVRAARMQEVDAQLAEVDRLLRLDERGAAGACGTCGALHSRGAVFCWQCGEQLLERSAAES